MRNNKTDTEKAEHALQNLKEFRAGTRLQQATYAFIASQCINKKEKEEIDKMFRIMDKDGDGKLNKKEVQEGYKEYFGKELSAQDVDSMFLKVDTDGSGEIDYSEFVIASMSEKDVLSNHKL